jgi:AcrR family transcriptional regulator
MAAVKGSGGARGGRGSVSRRELAVARVLDPARERAEGKVKAFLDAAQELISSDSGEDFTVQEVIERSGQSLRSFYQHFDGKHELLLALFEDAVNTSARQLRDAIVDEKSSYDRLRRFCIEYFRLCQPPSKSRAAKKGFAPGFASFAQQLLTGHPQEASHAFAPLTELLVELLESAEADGAIRHDLENARLAGVILQAVMFNAFAATIGGVPVQPATDDPAEQLWSLLINGIGERG